MLLVGCSGSADPGHAEEDYPRLAPWYLEATVEPGATLLELFVVSGACIDIAGDAVGFEPLERVDVQETDTQVVVSAWLGEPDTPRPHECAGVGIDIPAQVRLDEAFGGRELVDPACALPRYRQYVACTKEP